jgi:hypothetical protein
MGSNAVVGMAWQGPTEVVGLDAERLDALRCIALRQGSPQMVVDDRIERPSSPAHLGTQARDHLIIESKNCPHTTMLAYMDRDVHIKDRVYRSP